ncbi:hypothetical protein GCM10009596_01070 [Arthrobacter rhombi]|uniref:hypothetical protein n=1 Tax=Arthrobacter rhombi TaxID=71253 RepID=UPI0031DB8445
MSDHEKIEPGNGGNGPARDQAVSSDPSSLGADRRGSDDAEHRSVGGSAEGELVDVPGEDDETIRTLEYRQVPDGSGNDADDPDRRPDDDEDRYDAG